MPNPPILDPAFKKRWVDALRSGDHATAWAMFEEFQDDILNKADEMIDLTCPDKDDGLSEIADYIEQNL